MGPPTALVSLANLKLDLPAVVRVYSPFVANFSGSFLIRNFNNLWVTSNVIYWFFGPGTKKLSRTDAVPLDHCYRGLFEKDFIVIRPVLSTKRVFGFSLSLSLLPDSLHRIGRIHRIQSRTLDIQWISWANLYRSTECTHGVCWPGTLMPLSSNRIFHAFEWSSNESQTIAVESTVSIE